jgi:hypothetical protein
MMRKLWDFTFERRGQLAVFENSSPNGWQIPSLMKLLGGNKSDVMNIL